jgi:hypothetical protein
MESQQQQMESSNCISPGVIVTEPSTSSTSMNETTTADQGKNAITTSSVTDTNGNHISNKGNSSNMTNGNKTNVVIVPPSPTSSVASASSVVTTSMVTSCVSPSSLPSSTVVSSSSVGHSSQEVTSMVTSVVTSVQSVVDQEPQHPLQTSVVVPPLSYHTSSPSNSGHTVYSSQVNHSHGTHGNPNSSNNNIGSNNSGNGVGPPLPVESVQQPQQSYQTQQTGSSSSSSYHYSYTSQVMPEQVAYVIMESSNTSHEQQSQQLHSHSQVHSLDQDSNSMVNLQTGGNLVSNNNNSQRASPQEVSDRCCGFLELRMYLDYQSSALSRFPLLVVITMILLFVAWKRQLLRDNDNHNVTHMTLMSKYFEKIIPSKVHFDSLMHSFLLIIVSCTFFCNNLPFHLLLQCPFPSQLYGSCITTNHPSL